MLCLNSLVRTSDGALERGQEPFLRECRSGLSGMLQIMRKQYSKFAQLNYFLNDERRKWSWPEYRSRGKFHLTPVQRYLEPLTLVAARQRG